MDCCIRIIDQAFRFFKYDIIMIECSRWICNYVSSTSIKIDIKKKFNTEKKCSDAKDKNSHYKKIGTFFLFNINLLLIF